MIENPSESEKRELERIKDIIQKKTIDSLCRYDIRDHFLFHTILPRMEEDCRILRDKDENVLVRTCIGKTWACGLDFDYDASMFSAYVFWKTMCAGEQKDEDFWKTLSRKNQYEYTLSCSGSAVLYRGDIMNSWRTTVNEFFRICGNDYICGHHGRLIPEGYGEWHHFLAVPENYKQDLPSYLVKFMEVVYTIGNFFPVPEGFNIGRFTPTKDYWDLTLLSIYKYYKGNGAESKLATLFEKDAIRNWLNCFDNWDSFVEKNFMGPFFDESGHLKELFIDKSGYPKELWEGHFSGCSLPQTPKQFEQFFVNATECILARGKLMANALKNPESEKD